MRGRVIPEVAPALRDRIVFRHGAAAGAWLDALPATAEAFARRWGLTFDGAVASGSNGIVLRCRERVGRAAVLKLSPDAPTLAMQAAALAAWHADAEDGSAPVPAVWARDDRAGAVLLEAIEPGTPLAEVPELPALGQVAALLGALHRTPAPAASLQPLGARFDFIFGLWIHRREQGAAAAARVPAGTLERGLRLAVRLASDPIARPALVHGDLHASNVLVAGPGRGLVAIDPYPMIGDPAFDALDLALWRVADRAEVERRIALLAPAAGGDEERVRDWCAAFAAMLAVSLLVRGDGTDGQLALLLELAA